MDKIVKPDRYPDFILSFKGSRAYRFWFYEMVEEKAGGETYRCRIIGNMLHCIYNDDDASAYIEEVQDAYKKWLLDNEVNKILLGEDDV